MKKWFLILFFLLIPVLCFCEEVDWNMKGDYYPCGINCRVAVVTEDNLYCDKDWIEKAKKIKYIVIRTDDDCIVYKPMKGLWWEEIKKLEGK